MDDLFWFEGELGRTPAQDKYGGISLGAVTAHLNSRVIAEDKRPSTQFSNEGKKRVSYDSQRDHKSLGVSRDHDVHQSDSSQTVHLTSQKLITAIMIPTVFSHPCSITLHSAELEILTGKGNRNAGMIGFGYLSVTVRFPLVCVFT